METDSGERLCLYCTHLYIQQRSSDYSEFTPGEQHEISCAKGYWSLDPDDDTAKELRVKFAIAKSCKDYLPVRS